MKTRVLIVEDSPVMQRLLADLIGRDRGLEVVGIAGDPYEAREMVKALRPDVMLAWAMDGRPLARPHGAPLRLVMPAMYGYKSVKWVARIMLTRDPVVGYWEERGYDTDAWIGRSNGA